MKGSSSPVAVSLFLWVLGKRPPIWSDTACRAAGASSADRHWRTYGLLLFASYWQSPPHAISGESSYLWSSALLHLADSECGTGLPSRRDARLLSADRIAGLPEDALGYRLRT